MNEKALKYNSDFLSPESKHSINALPPPKKNVYIYLLNQNSHQINGKKKTKTGLYIYLMLNFIYVCVILRQLVRGLLSHSIFH